jgi:multidrug efflux pump subunit AcrA (membrane-fusion protein)
MTAGSAGEGKGAVYRCQRPDRLGPCPRPMRAMAKLADPVVEEQFLAHARQQAVELEGTSRRESDLDRALVAAEQAEAELDAMIAAQSASRFPEKFRKRLQELEDALVAAQDRVGELRASGHTESRRVDAVRLYTDPEATVADKRQLLAGAIERVEVHAPEGRSARGVPFSERSLVVFRD